MNKRYSIAEARDKFTSIIRDVERVSSVEITRRGKPVAVLLSLKEYRQLTAREKFWDKYLAFREQFDLTDLDISPQVFEGVRDSSPGRQVNL